MFLMNILDKSIGMIENRILLSNYFDILEEKHDFIIVDSPAILAAPDVKLIAGHVDGLILVVNWKNTSEETIVEATNFIKKTQGNALGIVINNAKLKQSHYYYYYYQ